MNCEGFRDRVFDFLEGGLADREAFEAHRASCAACADILRGIRTNERILRAAGVPAAPAGLWSKIAAAVARPAPRSRFPAGRWAAAAALLIGLLVFAYRPSPTLTIKVVDVGPDAARALGSFVPRYEGADTGLALGDYALRND